MVDTTPSLPTLRNLDTNEEFSIPEDGTCVKLNSASHRFRRADAGNWLLDPDGERTLLTPGAPFVLAGRPYVLLDTTLLAETAPPPCFFDRTKKNDVCDAMSECEKIPNVQVTLQVSDDEERVRLRIQETDRTYDLGYRTHCYFLTLLTRSRSDGSRLGAASENHTGFGNPREWIHTTEIAEALKCAQSDIDIWVFRTRRALAKQGCAWAHSIVERREGTGLLRLGPSNVQVLRSNRDMHAASKTGT